MVGRHTAHNVSCRASGRNSSNGRINVIWITIDPHPVAAIRGLVATPRRVRPDHVAVHSEAVPRHPHPARHHDGVGIDAVMMLAALSALCALLEGGLECRAAVLVLSAAWSGMTFPMCGCFAGADGSDIGLYLIAYIGTIMGAINGSYGADTYVSSLHL